MNFDEEIKRVHKIVSEKFKVYVEAIKEVYGEYMGLHNLKRLNEIVNYGDCVVIGTNGNINAYANNNGVYLPIEAYDVLKELSEFLEYGTDKGHKLFDYNNMIINDNTFYDYIKHIILTGSTPEDYYEDVLLHEVMHFCGSDGASALKEGINEYLTRKIAQKKGFRISSCGYPKEVKIVCELEKVFGEQIINQLAFINREDDIEKFIENKLGKDARVLYEKIRKETELEFQKKYYKYMEQYDGMNGVKLKAKNYENINYSNVYVLIDDFNKAKKDKIKKGIK